MSAGATARSKGLALGRTSALPLADGQREARRFIKRFGAMQTAANLLGAIDVFLLLFFVLPSPEVSSATEADVERLSLIIFLVALPILTVIANVIGFRLARPVRRALIATGPPDKAARDAVIRHPLTVAKMDAGIWAAGVVIALVAYSFYSFAVAFHVASTILMGGLTTVALAYLLGERMMRPIVERVLAYRAPSATVGPGVRGRLLLAWLLATGVPLLGLGAVALHVLVEGEVSADRMALSVVALAGAAATTGLVATVLVAKSVSEPLRAVRTALARIEEGDLDARVRVNDVSEVGLLQSGFNQMAVGLHEREQLRDLFGRHVGEDVARAALRGGAELGGEVRNVAVLFIDVLGSTTLAATQPPQEVVATLNRFFSVVVDAVGRHGGWVNKFEGDGALCVFGAPAEIPDPAGAALAAARMLRRRLSEELPDLDAAIGLSCGDAVAGNVGDERRFEYTVIGDPVNEAARLCELAKRRDERTVACGTMLDVAAPSEAAHWRTAEAMTLRGRLQPTQLALPA